jgi:hypothetical protein
MEVMPQLRVGHWVYRIEGQYLENPLFLRQNALSLSAAQLSSKMTGGGKLLEKYHGQSFLPGFIRSTL